MIMQSCNTFSAPQKDVPHFGKSLEELRDMRAQLYNAAEVCEMTFPSIKEKKEMVENTKEYVCRAIVSLVDHFGCVSDNIDDLIDINTKSFWDANLRIDCLKQRTTLSEQYNHKLALKTLQWTQIVPTTHQPRYLLTHIKEAAEKSDQHTSGVTSVAAATKTRDKRVSKKEEDRPHLVYAHKPVSSNLKEENNAIKLLPVSDNLPIISKTQNPLFHFQEMKKMPHAKRFGRKIHILTLFRMAKRSA